MYALNFDNDSRKWRNFTRTQLNVIFWREQLQRGGGYCCYRQKKMFGVRLPSYFEIFHFFVRRCIWNQQNQFT